MQNKIFLIGRLTKDPSLKIINLQENITVCRFILAVNRKFNNNQNENENRKNDETDFIPCVAWNKNAENLCKYVSKGKLVSIEGSLRINKFNGQNHQETKFYTEVVIKKIIFLS
jgi:single-strand DNA-binding protein